MLTKLPKISQSLLKALVDYQQDKACGYFIKARYFDKDPDAETEPTDSMKEGIYFEYLCTGALPKSGIVPEPEMTKKGELTADYKRVIEAAAFFKKTIEHYGIKILSVGKNLETPDGESGVLDIEAEWKGVRVIIDLKYSGLLYDKWSEMGWDLDSLPEKPSITVQAKQYKLLAKKCWGIEDIPFYFFVFNSKDPKDAKIIEVIVDESGMANHEVDIVNAKKALPYLAANLKPKPQLKRCNDCPERLAAKCPHRVVVPIIDQIQVYK